MSAVKGYSSNKKSHDYEESAFQTLQPVGEGRHAADVIAFNNLILVGADAVEASSTARVINATSHTAKKGMVIEMTSGSQSTEIGTVIGITTNTIILGQELSGTPSASDTFEIYRYSISKASSSGAISVTAGTRSAVDQVRNDYGSVNVTTGAYVELIASTSGAMNQLYIFDSSGETLILAFGAASSEVDQMYIFPGGFSGPVEINVPISTRVSIIAVSATASAGEFTMFGLS